MSKKLLLAAIAAGALLAPAMASAQPASRSAQSGYARLMSLDANHDGSLTHQEMENGRTALFNRVDTNHDGVISAAEREAARAALQTSGALAASVDTNSDGSITRDEFMSRPYPIFERFDADHNNVLDATEISTARARAAELMDKR